MTADELMDDVAQLVTERIEDIAALREELEAVKRRADAAEAGVITQASSVFPGWMSNLPMQQQSVLLLGARGPDGIAKAHPCKDVVRAYRGTVLKAAYFGRSLAWGEKADGFMSLDIIAAPDAWAAVLHTFFNTVDDLPHHYYLHLAHGAEILGFKHPDLRYRDAWRSFYERCCHDMHLTPETELEMDARLNDWARKHWDSNGVDAAEAKLAERALASKDGVREAAGHVEIAHDGFAGDIIGHYATREGKRGVVVQQDGTRVVHVYGEKWLSTPPAQDAPVGGETTTSCAHCNDTGLVAIRSSDGRYLRPGPVPEDARGVAEGHCFECLAYPGGFDGPTGAE